jgi:hypothetical protein
MPAETDIAPVTKRAQDAKLALVKFACSRLLEVFINPEAEGVLPGPGTRCPGEGGITACIGSAFLPNQTLLPPPGKVYCEDDCAAIVIAETLWSEHPWIEIWCGARTVRRWLRPARHIRSYASPCEFRRDLLRSLQPCDPTACHRLLQRCDHGGSPAPDPSWPDGGANPFRPLSPFTSDSACR